MLDDGLPGESSALELTFGFDAIRSIVRKVDGKGREVDRVTSRWEPSDTGSVVTGGGPGPNSTQAAYGGKLLQIGETRLDVLSHDWNASSSFVSGGDFEAARIDAAPFIASIPFSQAGSLYANLAAGSSLGNVVFIDSNELTGQLYRSWKLSNARLVSYEMSADTPGVFEPELELGFEFDTIEMTQVELSSHGDSELSRTVARWDVIPDPSPGPNVIAHNGASGVSIAGDFAVGNTIFGNEIFANGQLGIDLAGDGVTGNDFADGDQGANELQRLPDAVDGQRRRPNASRRFSGQYTEFDLHDRFLWQRPAQCEWFL